MISSPLDAVSVPGRVCTDCWCCLHPHMTTYHMIHVLHFGHMMTPQPAPFMDEDAEDEMSLELECLSSRVKHSCFKLPQHMWNSHVCCWFLHVSVLDINHGASKSSHVHRWHQWPQSGGVSSTFFCDLYWLTCCVSTKGLCSPAQPRKEEPLLSTSTKILPSVLRNSFLLAEKQSDCAPTAEFHCLCVCAVGQLQRADCVCWLVAIFI